MCMHTCIYIYVHALKGLACCACATPASSHRAQLQRGAHVACVPRLRLRLSFSRAHLFDAMWIKCITLMVHVLRNVLQHER